MKLEGKKILITGITDSGVLRVRSELIGWIQSEGAQVIVVTPKQKAYVQLQEMGCRFIEFKIDAQDVNPFNNCNVYLKYIKLLKEENPDVVLTFTTKPNIYCTLACKHLHIKYITNITGRGRALVTPGWKQKIMILLLKKGLTDAACVFFQNDGDMQFFLDNRIGNAQSFHRIPGSGVNLDKFKPVPYPSEDIKEMNFLFISRIYKQKGIEQYIEAASVIRKKHPECVFHILGENTPEYENMVNDAVANGIVKYHGRVSNVGDFIAKSHCTIHPSFFEGMANVVLESAACARPVITTNIYGCKEGVDDGVTGFVFKVKDADDLIKVIYRFLHLTYKEKVAMGEAGREKMEKEFDRQFVTEAYKEQILNLVK